MERGRAAVTAGDLGPASGAEAEKIADPSVRAGAQAILERDFRLAEAAATQRRKAGQEEIYAQVAKGLNPATLPPEVQQVIGADFVSQMQGLYQNNGKAPYDRPLKGRCKRRRWIRIPSRRLT